MSFSSVVFRTYQCKRFPNLDDTKKLTKENSAVKFIVYLTQMKVLIFTWNIEKWAANMVENSGKIIQHLLFFSDVTVLIFFSFNSCALMVQKDFYEWLNNYI